MAILAVGNLAAVAFAVILDNVGRVIPQWTGHGQLMKQKQGAVEAEIAEEKKVDRELKMEDIGAAIFLIGAFFVLAQLVAKKSCPRSLEWPFPILPT